MNKAIQQAAIAAAANTERTDASPQVVLREGQQEFAAASDLRATHGKEHVITEADIVAPGKGVESGDRAVEPKSKPKTAATKLAVKVRAICGNVRSCRLSPFRAPVGKPRDRNQRTPRINIPATTPRDYKINKTYSTIDVDSTQ